MKKKKVKYRYKVNWKNTTNLFYLKGWFLGVFINNKKNKCAGKVEGGLGISSVKDLVGLPLIETKLKKYLRIRGATTLRKIK